MTSIAFDMTSPRDDGHSGALPARPRGSRDTSCPPPADHGRCPRRPRLAKGLRLLPSTTKAANDDICEEVLELLRRRRPRDTRMQYPSGLIRTSSRRRPELETFGFADVASAHIPIERTPRWPCPLEGNDEHHITSAPQHAHSHAVAIGVAHVLHAHFTVTMCGPDLVVVCAVPA
jgi:hypothetical protein